MGQLKEEKEEEPEGEELGDKDTGSLLHFYPLPINLTDSKSYWYSFTLPSFSSFSSSDNSEEEEVKGRPLTQEEEDIDIIRSWVEVGGHPACQEEDAKELLT